MNTNPFNITKAVDYTDEQIFNFWVDLPNSGFLEILKPTSPMPMFILGAKGSGKTHIMRYYSFNLQGLRFKDIDLLKAINEDGYIGIYMRCSGLNSHRFSGRGQDIEAWKSVFSYYMELWLSQLLINSIIRIDFFKDSISHDLESKVTEQILSLFDKLPEEFEVKNLQLLSQYIKKLQKNVDYEINNCALTGSSILNINITVTSGKLIFGIPQILTESIPSLENTKFLYLIDEFENLNEYQQQYINTLIRERENPVTFRIGARLYGIRTKKTFSAGEELKEGSEYEEFIIDKIFREREIDYKEFVKNICINRLNKNGYSISHLDLANYFEEEDTDSLNNKKFENGKKYFKDLERKLSNYPRETVKEVISNLKYSNDILLERTNVFLFYRYWKKGIGDLVQASIRIKEHCDIYFKTKDTKSEHHIILDKYKNDITDQLFRELKSYIPYTGFNSFVKMSAGIPRHLLIILKHIFRWSSFNSESPFLNKNIISANSQLNGIKDAGEWFLSDAKINCQDPGKVQRCFDKIGRFLQEIRFSDLPPECSISSFSLIFSNLSSEAQKIIEFLEQYSYIIRVHSRRDKNTNRKDITFQINGIIAPIWELSIFRRGIVQLNNMEIKVIFEMDEEEEFRKILYSRLAEYNAPFQYKSLKLF